MGVVRATLERSAIDEPVVFLNHINEVSSEFTKFQLMKVRRFFGESRRPDLHSLRLAGRTSAPEVSSCVQAPEEPLGRGGAGGG